MPQLALTSTNILIACALLYSFLNGIQDGANTVATVITSRALPPRWALVLVSIAEFCGPFVFGVAVARTIGAGTVDASAMTTPVLIAALLSAGLWNVVTWRLGIPSSSSHALIGGLLGAVLAATGLDWGVLQPRGWLMVVVGLFAVPVISILASYWVMQGIKFVLRSATPKVNWIFRRGQLVTTVGLALSHGANDASKSMGLLATGLVAAGQLERFEVPLWVVAVTAGAMALGTLLGGYRIIRTLGTRFYRVRPIHAFSSQLASGLMVLAASLTGLPVSTSQVVSASIAGVGAAERFNKVRWGVMREVLIAWLLTIPLTALAGALAYLLIR